MNLLLVGEVIAGVAGVLAALTGIWRWFGIGKLIGGTGAFLDDWNGEPARRGYDGRPSFPERMTKVEERTAALNHDLRGELASRLTLLNEQMDELDRRTRQLQRNGGSSVADAVHKSAEGIADLQERAKANRAAIQGLDARLTGVDQRITDHRRRNEQQMEALRAEVEARLERTVGDEVRAATYRSILHELGLGTTDTDPPPQQGRLEQ